MIGPEDVEVRLAPELLADRRRQFVANADVDRQFGGDFPIVLHEERIGILE